MEGAQSPAISQRRYRRWQDLLLRRRACADRFSSYSSNTERGGPPSGPSVTADPWRPSRAPVRGRMEMQRNTHLPDGQ